MSRTTETQCYADTVGPLESLAQPHVDAPLWVQHAWLVHGAAPDGSRGEPCPDGCDGSDFHISYHRRLAAYAGAR